LCNALKGATRRECAVCVTLIGVQQNTVFGHIGQSPSDVLIKVLVGEFEVWSVNSEAWFGQF
jgi:hypothetical protein